MVCRIHAQVRLVSYLRIPQKVKMQTMFYCILALLAIFTSSVVAQVKPEEFLLQYGYLKEKTGSNRAENPTPEEMQKAILKYQNFNGLPETGTIDQETEKTMKAPRCGVKDFNDGFAEYTLTKRWPKELITWKIHKYSRTSKLSPAEQKRAIMRGLQRWAKVTPLVFRETRGKADINISFERWGHGDTKSFDGTGKTLAHAYYPTNGLTHFDDDEIWINGKSGGSDLETVAAHEFGHALGLKHSKEQKSMMASRYQVFPDNFKLHPDDIAGIQALYGMEPTRSTTPRSTTPRSTTPRSTTPRTTTLRWTTPIWYPSTRSTIEKEFFIFCNQAYENITAAMRISGYDIVFVDTVHVIDGRNGRKRSIKKIFPDGPDEAQAAVYSQKTRTAYLFFNKYVWAYSLDSAGQFQLSKGFPKYMPYVHDPECAIMVNYGTERIFLIKNGYFSEFLIYNGKVLLSRRYSTLVYFVNIPTQIDAAISSTHDVFFIAKKKAYRMSTRNRRVDTKGKPHNEVLNKC